jgi:hypothetical protein
MWPDSPFLARRDRCARGGLHTLAISPLNNESVLNYIGEHRLGVPRS